MAKGIGQLIIKNLEIHTDQNYDPPKNIVAAFYRDISPVSLSKINVDGNVDVAKPGTYRIKSWFAEYTLANEIDVISYTYVTVQ
ncbi:DUF5011 domain-containing protein [Lacticaseibacillus casei]|uniref:hypothetical protein n=1 Tax=Lacticaseibacillus casei TaxID=1582 RepID=UPI00237ED255|nr:hypothetical protein [Lacticaseibacillus casei]MDE3283423.1 DUF5011 domain-containing protein [Lacticaseibacillus casei]